MLDSDKLRAQGFQPYRKTAITYARQMTQPFRVRLRNGDVLSGAAGDYVAYSPGDDERWIVQRDIFEQTYAPKARDASVPDAIHRGLLTRGFRPYSKHQITWARKLTRPARVRTLEGEVHAETGDYLCVGPQGEMWPQPGARFEAVYQRVEGV